MWTLSWGQMVCTPRAWKRQTTIVPSSFEVGKNVPLLPPKQVSNRNDVPSMIHVWHIYLHLVWPNSQMFRQPRFP